MTFQTIWVLGVSKKIAKRVTAKKMYVLLSGMDLNDPKWEIDEKSTSDCEASQKNVSLSDKYELTLLFPSF